MASDGFMGLPVKGRISSLAEEAELMATVQARIVKMIETVKATCDAVGQAASVPPYYLLDAAQARKLAGEIQSSRQQYMSLLEKTL